MRHATGLANVSGLRSTCRAFCSVQAAASVTEESEQIKIKAVSILFPLAFLGGVVESAARTQHPVRRKQELGQLARWVRTLTLYGAGGNELHRRHTWHYHRHQSIRAVHDQ